MRTGRSHPRPCSSLERASGRRAADRLCAVQTQVASFAELAVRLRRERSHPGEVGRALAEGRLIKTWAMRGALHLLTPEDGGAFLSLIGEGRRWELPSWQRYFGLTPQVRPLAWLGELCHGPARGAARVAFTRPQAASRRWAWLPDPDEAGPVAVRAYLAAYGPATVDNFGRWLGAGTGRRPLRAAFAALGDALAAVEVDGERACAPL